MLPGMDGIAVTRDRATAFDRVLIPGANESSVVYEACVGPAACRRVESRADPDGVLAVARGEPVLPAEVAAGLVGEMGLRAPSLGRRSPSASVRSSA
jgi:hypothetical protein